MNKIKFSHLYEKMTNVIPVLYGGVAGSTQVLEVLTTTKKDLSPEFIKYDTEIKTYKAVRDLEGKIVKEEKYYPLPDGKLIVILLLTNGHLWTTIRRQTEEKEAYYRSLRGQEVGVVIEEKENK